MIRVCSHAGPGAPCRGRLTCHRCRHGCRRTAAVSTAAAAGLPPDRAAWEPRHPIHTVVLSSCEGNSQVDGLVTSRRPCPHCHLAAFWPHHRSWRPRRDGRRSGHQRCFASHYAERACGSPLTLETSADPARLTARARPEARPDRRAANLGKLIQKLAEAGKAYYSVTWNYID